MPDTGADTGADASPDTSRHQQTPAQIPPAQIPPAQIPPRYHPDTGSMRASRANAAFWLGWLGLAAWCYLHTFDDPSSIFYDAARAYRLRFSTVRTAEVDRYLQRMAVAAPRSRLAPPLLCVGIPSVKRTTESFLGHAVGSLVDTLTPAERELVYLVVLLADKAPQTHFAYAQPWLGRLADEVVVYGDGHALANANANATANATANYRAIPYDVRDTPRGDGRTENMRLDHSVLVERCRRQATPFFALVEDDVIASRDWFARFRSAVQHVDRAAQKTGRDWIYLRLFYSELLMGWNAEEWLSYAEVVFGVYAVLLLVLLALRRRHRHRHRHRHRRSPAAPSAKASAQHFDFMAAQVLGLWTPALIALFFMAGRISLRRLVPPPLRGAAAGVREMPNYGCCAQGLVFPERHLEGLQALLRNPPFAFAGDQILEDYARDRGLAKWALDPSVLQHSGRRESSRLSGPRKADVWNFSFERQQR
ncbi:hypothetical protein TOPH_03857 [Tolypocladium ophioglossoides CBS 100239]|uniref:Integral membrane protein n=1 Tax=Tolypocladium ophioglossoides (strain CBS 100239) TaxID=1163406 RepID=A0A0L0ND43_TOLOC|nr:hypothetical protein TOPH_03857 [Tolypocladium ophioglossoides CBS 100239]